MEDGKGGKREEREERDGFFYLLKYYVGNLQ
jgi:hypothetical protein